MAQLDPNYPIGWTDESETTTDPRDAVKKLLLIFVSVVGGLLDDRNWRLLNELLRIMQDNIDATKDLMEAIKAGANVDDVRALLERRK